MSSPGAALFESVRDRGALASLKGRRVLAAVSGGLDSTVLLHLLRFHGVAQGIRVMAAHFDHRMRHCSGEDGEWLRGLCRAWTVPLVAGRAEATPRSEADAREARYAFLETARRETGAEFVVTAHHADDQAETVLFRLLRGTGTPGLIGIHERREPALVRPLLGVWREDLEAYARAVRLSWRDDPTNDQDAYARNVIRRHLLPLIETHVAPGARHALVRLSEVARSEEEAWRSLMPDVLASVVTAEADDRVAVSRTALAGLQQDVRTRVLRELAGRFDLTLDRRSTALAAGFAADAASGRSIDLGRGVVLARELEELVIRARRASGPDRDLVIPGPRPGSGEARLGGRPISVRWTARARRAPGSGEGDAPVEAAFAVDDLRFPLTVRARLPGDRVRTRAGTKKVKKIMLAHRIPPEARPNVPLLVDSEGEVLWMPGVVRSRTGWPREGVETLSVGVG